MAGPIPLPNLNLNSASRADGSGLTAQFFGDRSVVYGTAIPGWVWLTAVGLAGLWLLRRKG